MEPHNVGIDFHRRRSVIVCKNEAGEVVSKTRIANEPVAHEPLTAGPNQATTSVSKSTAGGSPSRPIRSPEGEQRKAVDPEAGFRRREGTYRSDYEGTSGRARSSVRAAGPTIWTSSSSVSGAA